MLAHKRPEETMLEPVLISRCEQQSEVMTLLPLNANYVHADAQGATLGNGVSREVEDGTAQTGRRTTYLTHDAVDLYSGLLKDNVDQSIGASVADAIQGHCLLAFVSGVVQSKSKPLH